MDAQIRLALPGAAVADGVEDGVGIYQVVSAHQVPVEEPLDFVQGELPAVGAADFGEDAARAVDTGPAGGGFGGDAVVSLDSAGAARFDVAPDHVLTRNAEKAQAGKFVAAGGVAGEGDVVGGAPVGLGGVEDLVQAGLEAAV